MVAADMHDAPHRQRLEKVADSFSQSLSLLKQAQRCVSSDTPRSGLDSDCLGKPSILDIDVDQSGDQRAADPVQANEGLQCAHGPIVVAVIGAFVRHAVGERGQ